MENEFFDLPIFNSNLENIFEREKSEDFNDSIFLANEFEELQQQSHFEIKSIPETKDEEKKRVKHYRKDDFDYNAYIQKELKSYDTEKMSENLKKHMIQKIRNRMSAQRSRIRQKNMQEYIEKENKSLKVKNLELKKEVHLLREQNETLKNKIKLLETSRTTECSSEEERTLSEKSEFIRARNKNLNLGLNKVHAFLLLAAVLVIFIPNGASIHNSVTKMGGIVPMIGLNLPQMNKQLKTIDEMCRGYCEKQNILCQEDYQVQAKYGSLINNILTIDHQSEKSKQIELFDKFDVNKLVCFNPTNANEKDSLYRVIVNSATFSKLNNEEIYYGEFQKLVLE